jgi:hypothetical protein
MRKFVLLAFISSIFCRNLHSQIAEDSIIYNPGIQLLERAKTTENYLEAAFYFDQVAHQFPEHWLALYYTAYSYIQAGRVALVSIYKDELIDKAQPLIDKALSMRPGESELNALQALSYQIRLQVNPETRAFTYSQKADASLKKSVELNSDNPRAYFLLGNNLFYTPALIGGGPKNALPLFLKAREKFNVFKPELSFLPHWGRQENQLMITECSKTK